MSIVLHCEKLIVRANYLFGILDTLLKIELPDNIVIIMIIMSVVKNK